MSEVVDYAARASAAEANRGLASHEDRCSERWEQSRIEARATRAAVEALSAKVSSSVSGIYSRIWWLIGGAFGVAIVVIGWLATKAL